MIVRSLSLTIVACAAVASAAGASTIALTDLGPSTLAASVNAGCKNPDIAPQLVDAPQVVVPELALLERGPVGPYGTTTVEVDLDEQGALAKSLIFRSSGDTILDGEALKAVRDSRFVAERHGCKAIAGAYAVVIDFDNNIQ